MTTHRHPKAQLDHTDHKDFQTPAGMAAAFRRNAALNGHDPCPIAGWWEAQPWDGTPDGMANLVYEMHHHKEFGAFTCAAGLLSSEREGYTPKELAKIQLKALHALLDHPFSQVHAELDARLGIKWVRFYSSIALREVLDFMKANHPHWVEWAQREWNIRHIPDDYEIAPGIYGAAKGWPPFRGDEDAPQ